MAGPAQDLKNSPFGPPEGAALESTRPGGGLSSARAVVLTRQIWSPLP